MKLPKYITHPLLIVIMSTGLFFMLWIKSPSEAQMPVTKSTTQTVPQGAQTTKAFLDQSKMHQITDLLPEGYVTLDGVTTKIQINNPRFKALTIDQAEKLKDFFLGKFVRVEDTAKQLALDLPLELYEPGCFSSDPNVVNSSKQCPLVLQP